MGSCMSGDKRVHQKDDITTVENRSTKIEGAQQRRVSQMNSKEKMDFLCSNELSEYLKVCGVAKPSAFKDIMKDITPSEETSLIKYIRQVVAKISTQKDKTPPPSNPNHSQFVSILYNYSSNLEKPLEEYVSRKELSVSTLVESFNLIVKILVLSQTLLDPDLKSEEKWWGTGGNNTALFAEVSNCKTLLGKDEKQVATDYLAELYGNLNFNIEKE